MLTRPALSPVTGFCVMLYVSTAHASTSKPPLSLESIFSSSEFNSDTLDNMQWSADETSFTFTRRSPKTGLLNLYEHELASGENQLLISSEALT